MVHGVEVKLANQKVNWTGVEKDNFRLKEITSGHWKILAYRDAIDQIIGDKHIVCPGIEMLQNFANKKNVKSNTFIWLIICDSFKYLSICICTEQYHFIKCLAKVDGSHARLWNWICLWYPTYGRNRCWNHCDRTFISSFSYESYHMRHRTSMIEVARLPVLQPISIAR